MSDPEAPAPERRRRRALLRSLGVASAAAFAGGVAVVGVQYGLGIVSAGYPPVLQSLTCAAEGQEAPSVGVTVDGGALVPVVEVPLHASIACRIDAPGADYATWSVIGPVSGIRAGPLDPTLPCQSPEDFAHQDTSLLRLSACQRMTASRPGLHLLSVTVMLRGLHAADRTRLLLRVAEPPAPAAPPRGGRLAVTLRLPAMDTEQVREADLTASFGEHGLVPQSRRFERTVYRLAPGEDFVSASFRARSAANASAVQLAYAPATRAVTARFTLRSGSLIDRWRGWIAGTVAVRVRLHEDARDLDLGEVDLPVPGRVEMPLPEGVDPSGGQLALRRPETGQAILLSPGAAAMLDGARVSASARDGALVLEAAPRP